MANWSAGGKGAAGGAMTGAAAGSVFGPWGTVIGGVGGGIIGGIGGLMSDEESGDEKRARQMLMDYYAQIQGRQPVQLGATQYGQVSQDIRGRQMSLADQLEAISTGKGPSLAEQQLRSATDRNVSQQASFANSGRGGMMAAGRAANNSARLGAVAAQDAGVARVAEANQARQLLGLNLHGMREADESMSRFNAGQGNEMSQAQMWATLKNRGMTDDAIFRTIAGLQGQNIAVSGRPDFSDQMLAGGAGMYSQYMSQKAASNAAKKT